MIRPIILASCLVKKGNKYLLVQEATDKIIAGIDTHSKGKWTTPHGQADKGEEIQEAAERELLEEAGGKTKIKRLGVVATGTLEGSIYIISFVFYGEGFKRTGKRWRHEIKKTQWFTKKEIKVLEKKRLMRDNVPVAQFIKTIETGKKVEFIKWKHPEYVKEIFRIMDKTAVNITKEQK